MSDDDKQTSITPEDPDIPDAPPAPGGGTTEVPDQPLGVQPDADPDEAGLPGIPTDEEPPQDA